MSQKVRQLNKCYQRSYIMILSDLSNTIKKLWEKISFHKHFKAYECSSDITVEIKYHSGFWTFIGLEICIEI